MFHHFLSAGDQLQPQTGLKLKIILILVSENPQVEAWHILISQNTKKINIIFTTETERLRNTGINVLISLDQ